MPYLNLHYSDRLTLREAGALVRALNLYAGNAKIMQAIFGEDAPLLDAFERGVDKLAIGWRTACAQQKGRRASTDAHAAARQELEGAALRQRLERG